MTWSEFVTAVYNLMPVDSVRLNMETLYDAWMRQAVVDLQDQIVFYRQGQQTFYELDDIVQTQLASVGSLPDQAYIIDAWVVLMTGTNCCRTPVDDYPWENRHDLICGHVAINKNALIAIDPYAQEFTLFPALDADTELEINWDGLKRDFDDEDNVPFDDDAANAVSLYMLAQISRKIKNDLQMHDSYMRDWLLALRRLYVRKKDLTVIRGNKKSQQTTSVCAQCECATEIA